MSAELLPGDRNPDVPTEWEPSADGFPPLAAQTGVALESALLLLEGRRWWLEQYCGETPEGGGELAAVERAIAAVEQALVWRRRATR